MQAYEIRILNPDDALGETFEIEHLDPNGAVRAARKMAQGKPVEVWRAGQCIYGADRMGPSRTPHENDVYGTARKMTEVYGERAAMTAAQRAEVALETKNRIGSERWQRIMAAIRSIDRSSRGRRLN